MTAKRIVGEPFMDNIKARNHRSFGPNKSLQVVF